MFRLFEIEYMHIRIYAFKTTPAYNLRANYFIRLRSSFPG